MSATVEGRIAEWKVRAVNELRELIEEFPVIGIVDISEVPAKQLQLLRQKLGSDTRIVVAKNTLIARALDGASGKPGLAELKKFLTGQSAVVFSKRNPFKLNSFLRENRVNAPARVGSVSSRDVVIPAGETDFPPGPMVAELQKVGIKARIQAGKVVILEECRLVRAGDVITKEISDTLAKFGILPVELGLRMRAAYEGGVLFSGEILDFDEKKAIEQIRMAWSNAFNLSFNVRYPTRANITFLILEAHTRAMNLALNERLPVREAMPFVLREAHMKMLFLACVAGGRKREALDPELARAVGLPTEDIKREDAEEKKQKTEQQG